MPNRKLILPLLLLLTTLLAPSPATAATYTVHSCQTPTGRWVGADGWVADAGMPVSGHDNGVISACTIPGTPFAFRFGDTGLSVVSGAALKLAFRAPVDTTIVTMTMLRTFDLGWPMAPEANRPYAFHAWYGTGETSRFIDFQAPMVGGDNLTITTPTLLERTNASWDSITVSLRCWGFSGSDDCGSFPAALAIQRLTMGLLDSSAPSADFDCCATTVRGNLTVGFTATDEGGGVYRSILTVDGAEAERTVVDANQGKCGDVEADNGDAYEFASPQPCPLSVGSDVSFDTRGLIDGEHTVGLSVEDAAGNRSPVVERTITTHNAPVSVAAPAIAGDARVGGSLTGGLGQWDGVPTQYEQRWLRCDADGDGCVPVVGASGGTYVPVSADAYHRIVAEVVAGNGSGSATAHSAPSALVADAAGRTSAPDPAAGGDPDGADPDSTGPDTNHSPDTNQGPDTNPGPDTDEGAGGPDAPAGGGPGTPAATGVGGIPNLQNPLADQTGRAPNGGGASAQARVSISLRLAGGRSARTVRSKRDRRWTVVGRVTDAKGQGIAGARLNVLRRVSGRRWAARGLVRSDEGGRFTVTLPPGPSRTVKLTYFPFGESNTFRTSNTVTIDVLSPLTIKVDRRVLTGKRIVNLSGRAGGESIPAAGLLVTLQGYQRGWGWRTFRTVRTNRRGAWRTSYRFRTTSGRFAFRAIVPKQGRYPFATTTSASVSVTVK